MRMGFRYLLTFTIVLCLPFMSKSQMKSRSGNTNPASGAAYASLPCSGTTIFSEDFTGGLPGTWSVIDVDGNTPQASIGLSAGWQSMQDYKDTTNTAMGSPSWYNPTGQSDDWLITPQITLGSNSCLSWSAYSQDIFYKEAYEIRISTTTADTAGFMAEPVLLEVAEENHALTYRSVNLAAYAGQSVYIAFRQVSDDKFVLVLDDVLVTEANSLDAGVYEISSTSVGLGDTLTVTGEIANYGSDTLQTVSVHYQVAGGSIMSMTFDSLALGPNETVAFSHDSLYIADTLDQFLALCAWTSNPNGSTDEDASNDSTCVSLSVGAPVSVAPALSGELKVFPNPLHDRVRLQVVEAGFKYQLMDLSGRLLREGYVAGTETELELSSLPAGMYLLRVEDGKGRMQFERLIKE